MQYIQLQKQSNNNIPNANISGSVNLFVQNNNIVLKDEFGNVYVNDNTLNKLEIDLGWSTGTTIGVNGEVVRLLDLNVNIDEILNSNTGEEVWLYIERYKNYKRKGNNDPNFVKSGWKHDVNSGDTLSLRPSEIQLTSSKNNDFYFGQEKYFNVRYYDTENILYGGIVKPKGLNKKKESIFNRSTSVCVYLRFRLKIGNDVNGWVLSKPLSNLCLVWEFEYNLNDGTYKPKLNYKFG